MMSVMQTDSKKKKPQGRRVRVVADEGAVLTFCSCWLASKFDILKLM
jgi:hypothetical protein